MFDRLNLYRVGSVAAGVCGVWLLTGVSLSAQDADYRPVTDAMLQNPDDGDWLNWRRTLDGWGYSPLDEITSDNAGDLRLAWSWALAEGSQQTTPLVHDGIMYIANPGAIIHALDAASGELIWEYRRAVSPGQPGRTSKYRWSAAGSYASQHRDLSRHHHY